MKLVPLIPLDSDKLRYGPYTDDEFQAGRVSCADLGLLYGYTYRPVRFTGDEDKIMGTTTFHPNSIDETGKVVFGERFPWCASRDEAVNFLIKHGYYGHVQRYALDPHVLRDEWHDVILLANSPPVRRKYEPWCTAGITDVVNAPSETSFHGHILNNYEDMTIYPRIKVAVEDD